MVDRCSQAEDPASAQDVEKEAREVGQLLREARLAEGKEDLGRIARYLWVPLEHLEALERGDLRHAPGYPDPLVLVRRYAYHVGLDGSRLAQRLGMPFQQAGAPSRSSRRGLAHAPGVRLALALGVTLLLTAAPITGYRMGPEPAADSTAPEVLVETGSPAPSSLAHAGLPDAGVAATAAQGGRGLDSGLPPDPPVGPSSGASAPTVELRPAVALAQEDAGEVYRKATELYRANRYEQALPLFEKALKLTEARHGSDNPRLALDLNNLGEIYRLLGRHEAAEPLFHRAIALAGGLGANGRGLASSLNNLALLYRDQGQLEDALRLQERAVAASERENGPDHPNLATSLNNLAALYRLRGEPAKAKPLQERGLAIAERALGPDNPMTKAFRRDLDLAEESGTRKPEARPAAAQPPSRVPTPPLARPEPPPLAAPTPADLPIITAAPALSSTAGTSPSTESDRKPVAVRSHLPSPLALLVPPPVATHLPSPLAPVVPPPVATHLPSPLAPVVPPPVATHLPSPLAPVVPPPVANLIDAARGTSNAAGTAAAGTHPAAIAGLPETGEKDGTGAVRLASPLGGPAAVLPPGARLAERQQAIVPLEPPSAAESRTAGVIPPDVHTRQSQGASVGGDRVADLPTPVDMAPASSVVTRRGTNSTIVKNFAATDAPAPQVTDAAAGGAPDLDRDRPKTGGDDGATASASSLARPPRRPPSLAAAAVRPRQAAALQGPTERPAQVGRFAVLVSSMRDLADVPEEWRLLRQHYPALASLELWPPAPEVTESEVVYRLVAGYFVTAAEAEAVCDELRWQDQQCRVVPWPGDREDRRSIGVRTEQSTHGDFAIQVALVRDPAEVLQEWQRLASRYPSLADLEPRPPRPAEVVGRGTFHGVVGGSFATTAEARAACERLRGEGGECLVITP